MPYPTNASIDAAIAAGKIKAADLIDFYVKNRGTGVPFVLRAWTWPGTASYPGTVALDGSTASNDYESMYGRLVIAKTIRTAQSLSSEPLRIQLDASRSADNADWVGRFVDSDWHQGRVRMRQVLLDWDSEVLGAVPLREWYGLLDHAELVYPSPDGGSEPATWDITCQAGLFRVRGRRLKTRSHADQQNRSAGDLFYVDTATMVGRPLNWAKALGATPGRATGSGGSAAGGNGGLPSASLFRGTRQ
jgi:hypothetical protein